MQVPRGSVHWDSDTERGVGEWVAKLIRFESPKVNLDRVVLAQ